MSYYSDDGYNNSESLKTKTRAFKDGNEDDDGDGGDGFVGGDSSGGIISDESGKVDYEKLKEISNYCNVSFELLRGICEQIEKIIEYKRKKQTSSTGQKDDLYRRQVVEFMLALENLVKINGSLGTTAGKVKVLCVEANNLLNKGLGISKSIGPSLGGSSGISEENSDSDDDAAK